MAEITIREPGQMEAEQLAAMLCNDNVLRRELGFAPDDHLTAGDVLRELAEWSKPRRATTYAILADNTVVGTITLSHRSPDGLSAQVGYWIGSGYRRLGYCTKAFDTVLDQAASEGITSISAAIASDNTPSRRIWERREAVAWVVSPGRLQFNLKVEKQPASAGRPLQRA